MLIKEEASTQLADPGAFGSGHSEGRTNILDRIVPPYDRERPDSAYCIAATRAMEEYARSRWHQLRLPPAIDAKFARLMKALAEIPYVEPMDQQIVLDRYPDLRGLMRLLEGCLVRYPEILTGKINPLSVLFPGGSPVVVEAAYRDNPVADYCNKVVADVVRNYVYLQSGKQIRMIEIGAGTGATTQRVLPAISNSDVEYVFTDLSYGFLNKAKARFAHYPFVSFGVYNIEKKPVFERPFDIVIASNVIHATGDVRNALVNVRKLLSADGILVVNEFTARKDYATLTFGLTEGWWLNADGQRIEHSPLIDGEVWRSLIRAAGFPQVASHGSEEQQVIVATGS